jgi:hypothetical protein
MNEATTNTVTVVLSIGSVLSPLFFGGIFLFIFKYFPTRKEIELQESSQLARHLENQRRFETIETDVKELLARSA